MAPAAKVRPLKSGFGSQVHLSVDVAEFRRGLDQFQREQFPFAMALTLTRSAEEAVQAKIGDLPARFHVRNSWVAKGFRVRRATKRNLVAVIEHKDSYMLTQEMGGKKMPTSSKSVAIPHGQKFAGARGTVTQTTPKSKWPGRIKRSFFIHKDGVTYEFARQGPRTRKRHKSRYDGRLLRDIQLEKRGLDPNLKLMYVMRPSVQVKPRLGMLETVQKIAFERMPANFAGFLEYAMRTAK